MAYRILRSGFFAAICAVVWLTPASHLFGQVERGTLASTVTDTTGAGVPKAEITVVNVETGFEFRTVTNEQGEFVAPNLIPGRYRVVVSHQGFKTLEREDLIVRANDRLAVTLSLDLGTATEKVEVRGEFAPLLQKETSTVTGVLETQQVTELPTLDRTIFNLAMLTVGVVEANLQSNSVGIPDNARAAVGLNANGLGNFNAVNEFILDGVNNTFAAGSSSYPGILPPVEAIQEFTIDTSGSAAEMGRGGTVIRVTLKSGTNKLHGSSFEFSRNAALNARNFFDRKTAATPRRLPNFVQNEFGFTLGGPIRKDRTFFFADYQGLRQRQGQTWLSTVPSAAVRAGDFNNTAQPVYDPTAYNAATNTSQPFPGSTIPASRFSPAAKAVLNYYPLPNDPSGALTPLGQGLFYSASSLQRTQDAFDIKVDHRISDRDWFTGRYSNGRSHALLPGAWTDLAQYAPAHGGALQQAGSAQYLPGLVSNPAQNVGLQWIHNFSATTLNEVRASWLRTGADATHLGYGQNYGNQLGIPNANVDNWNSGFPGMSIAGVTPVGESGAYPLISIENAFQYLENLTLIRGSHTFKTGADIRRLRWTFLQHLGAIPGGTFSFTQDITADPQRLTTTGNAMASFLLGIPASASLGRESGTFGLRWWEASGYFQDTWKVSRKLTLNYGLRYELFTPLVEVHDRMANFDAATGKLVLPGQGGSSPCLKTRALMCTDWLNFEPRLGLAYQMTPKTVVRLGYALQSAQGDGKSLGFKVLNPPFTGGQTFFNTAVPQQIVRTLDQGFVATPNPFSPIDNPGVAIRGNNPDPAHAYTQQWSVGFQRELASNLALEVNYIGNSGVHYDGQVNSYNLNPAVLGTGPVPQRTLYYGTIPSGVSVSYFDSRGRGHYHALQPSLTKRFANGLSLGSNFNWGHSLAPGPPNGPSTKLWPIRRSMRGSGLLQTGCTSFRLEPAKGSATIFIRLWMPSLGGGASEGSWRCKQASLIP